MALIRCEFFSDVLEMSTSMTVILPQSTSAQIGMEGTVTPGSRHPVLYLLHGLSDDDTVWVRRTSIERYVAPLGLAVIMPQVHRSYYSDEVHGRRFWTFLSEELPTLVGDFFPVSRRREETFVAGLSMGGYGAFKWALRHPEKFAAAASLSGALDLVRTQEENNVPDVMDRVFGGRPVAGTPDDLLWLLGEAATAGADLPALYLACGEQDVLIDQSRTFLATARRHGIEVTADIGPGEHEWGYWDATVQDVLAWLPLGASVQR